MRSEMKSKKAENRENGEREGDAPKQSALYRIRPPIAEKDVKITPDKTIPSFLGFRSGQVELYQR